MAFKFIDVDKNRVLSYKEIKACLIDLTYIITGQLEGKVIIQILFINLIKVVLSEYFV